MAAATAAVIEDIYDAWRTQNIGLMASYLPDDFCHVIHVTKEIHPLGGVSEGKRASLDRFRIIAADFDFLSFDTGRLMFQRNYAGVEIPVRYRHRVTGTELQTNIVNFWTLEDGWPVRLDEYHDVVRLQAFTHALAATPPG